MADTSKGVVKYTSRDYESIMQDFWSVVPALTDLWKPEAESDPGVVLGKFLASVACVFGGKKRKNHLLNIIAFGSYTKRIKTATSGLDWLSTDENEVRKYAEDPRCGFTFTSDGFRTLFSIVAFMQSKTAYAQLPDRPSFFAYGSEDPVGSYGTGVEKVIATMTEAGAKVKSKNYGAYRHELMNEPAIKEQYFKDLVDFYDALPLA